MWTVIQAFTEKALGMKDEAELFQLLEHTAADLGYPYWAFGALWGDPEAIKQNPAPAVRLNYPPAWIEHYFKSGYDKIDPVVSVSPYAQTSVTWTELRHYRPEFFDDAASHGLRAGISIPLRMSARHLIEGATHPHWAWQMLRGGLPQFENVRGLMGAESAGLTIAAKVGQSLDAAYGWDDLARLRARWPRKLLVKGIGHPADAVRLAALGVDGLWISNHGGRQLDGAIASADALPRIAEALKQQQRPLSLIVDSGVRRGIDALKARALGAEAVAVGRAALFGACAGGQPGVDRALDILTSEMALALKLSGVAGIDQVDHGLLDKATLRPV